MSNETKQDVLKDIVDTLHVMDGAPDDYCKKLIDRYDDALPDDLPVIPLTVGDAIKIHKNYVHSLLDIFGALSIYGVSRTEPSLDYNAWIVHHPDDFSHAWVLDAWRVEETGEIVKLEAEK